MEQNNQNEHNDNNEQNNQNEHNDNNNIINNNDNNINNKDHIYYEENNIDKNQKIYHVNKNTLKSFILEWLSLDDQIKLIRNKLKEISDEKKQYESQILELMLVLNQDTIQTDKGKIEKNVKRTKMSLTPELIKNTLSDLLKCNQTADLYTNNILDKRQQKELITLKRNKPKKEKKQK